MKSFTLLAVLLTTILISQATIAQTQKEKDRNDFISNVKVLEKRPLDPKARAAREWGFRWLVDTDDVSVTLCTDTMKLIPEKKNKFKSELLMQFSFGMAVFKLENPDRKSDEYAANLAGVESVLRTYEAMVSEDEKAKNPELDALVIKRGNGELKSVVDAAAARCTKNDKSK